MGVVEMEAVLKVVCIGGDDRQQDSNQEEDVFGT
jgi:hypothetical protein